MKATIYGASDDLVEVEGDINEEFNVDAVTLIFGDGTHVRARYGKDGLWHVTVERLGTAKVVSVFTASDPDSKDYSDRLTIEGDLVCVDAYQDEEARNG